MGTPLPTSPAPAVSLAHYGAALENDVSCALQQGFTDPIYPLGSSPPPTFVLLLQRPPQPPLSSPMGLPSTCPQGLPSASMGPWPCCEPLVLGKSPWTELAALVWMPSITPWRQEALQVFFPCRGKSHSASFFRVWPQMTSEDQSVAFQNPRCF